MGSLEELLLSELQETVSARPQGALLPAPGLLGAPAHCCGLGRSPGCPTARCLMPARTIGADQVGRPHGSGRQHPGKALPQLGRYDHLSCRACSTWPPRWAWCSMAGCRAAAAPRVSPAAAAAAAGHFCGAVCGGPRTGHPWPRRQCTVRSGASAAELQWPCPVRRRLAAAAAAAARGERPAGARAPHGPSSAARRCARAWHLEAGVPRDGPRMSMEAGPAVMGRDPPLLPPPASGVHPPHVLLPNAHLPCCPLPLTQPTKL